MGQNEFVQKIYEQDSAYLRKFKTSVTEWDGNWKFLSSGTLNEEGWDEGDSLYFITWLSKSDSLTIVQVDTYTTHQIQEEAFQYNFIGEYYIGDTDLFITRDNKVTFRFEVHLTENKRYRDVNNFNLLDFNEWVLNTLPYDQNEAFFIAIVTSETDNENCAYRFSKRPGTILFEEIEGWVSITNLDDTVEIKLIEGENCLELDIE